MATTRITAGAWRGRQVLTPAGLDVRPSTALVRQAVFNILGDVVRGADVVDLYAGAGTFGFEALSRGARSVLFVEHVRRVATVIERTAQRLGCDERVRIVVADAVPWLQSAPRQVSGAGICFVDAPYRDDGVLDALAALGASPPALVVCEHHRRRRLPDAMGRLQRVREATYGSTTVTFLRRFDPDAEDQQP